MEETENPPTSEARRKTGYLVQVPFWWAVLCQGCGGPIEAEGQWALKGVWVTTRQGRLVCWHDRTSCAPKVEHDDE